MPKLTDYSNTWYFHSSADSAALSGFGLSEAHLFKEFASHVAEPLKDSDTVNLQYEAVFLIRITFKFRLGVLGGETAVHVPVNKEFQKILTIAEQESAGLSG